METMSPGSQRTSVSRSGPTKSWLGAATRAEDVAGQLADVAAGQTRAKGSASHVNHPIELKIGLPVSSADGEGTIGAGPLTGGEANQAGNRGPQPAASLAPIPGIDQSQRRPRLCIPAEGQLGLASRTAMGPPGEVRYSSSLGFGERGGRQRRCEGETGDVETRRVCFGAR